MCGYTYYPRGQWQSQNFNLESSKSKEVHTRTGRGGFKIYYIYIKYYFESFYK